MTNPIDEADGLDLAPPPSSTGGPQAPLRAAGLWLLAVAVVVLVGIGTPGAAARRSERRAHPLADDVSVAATRILGNRAAVVVHSELGDGLLDEAVYLARRTRLGWRAQRMERRNLPKLALGALSDVRSDQARVLGFLPGQWCLWLSENQPSVPVENRLQMLRVAREGKATLGRAVLKLARAGKLSDKGRVALARLQPFGPEVMTDLNMALLPRVDGEAAQIVMRRLSRLPEDQRPEGFVEAVLAATDRGTIPDSDAVLEAIVKAKGPTPGVVKLLTRALGNRRVEGTALRLLLEHDPLNPAALRTMRRVTARYTGPSALVRYLKRYPEETRAAFLPELLYQISQTRARHELSEATDFLGEFSKVEPRVLRAILTKTKLLPLCLKRKGLLTRLAGSNETLRELVYELLRSGRIETIPALIDVLRSLDGGLGKAQVEKILSIARTRGGRDETLIRARLARDPAAAGLLIEKAKNAPRTDTASRLKAVRDLAGMVPTDETRSFAVGFLGDKDRNVRAQAAALLAQRAWRPRAAQIPAFLEQLRLAPRSERRRLASLLRPGTARVGSRIHFLRHIQASPPDSPDLRDLISVMAGVRGELRGEAGALFRDLITGDHLGPVTRTRLLHFVPTCVSTPADRVLLFQSALERKAKTTLETAIKLLGREGAAARPALPRLRELLDSPAFDAASNPSGHRILQKTIRLLEDSQ